jgi:hypothetical protein
LLLVSFAVAIFLMSSFERGEERYRSGLVDSNVAVGGSSEYGPVSGNDGYVQR